MSSLSSLKSTQDETLSLSMNVNKVVVFLLVLGQVSVVVKGFYGRRFKWPWQTSSPLPSTTTATAITTTTTTTSSTTTSTTSTPTTTATTSSTTTFTTTSTTTTTATTSSTTTSTTSTTTTTTTTSSTTTSTTSSTTSTTTRSPPGLAGRAGPGAPGLVDLDDDDNDSYEDDYHYFYEDDTNSKEVDLHVVVNTEKSIAFSDWTDFDTVRFNVSTGPGAKLFVQAFNLTSEVVAKDGKTLKKLATKDSRLVTSGPRLTLTINDPSGNSSILIRAVPAHVKKSFNITVPTNKTLVLTYPRRRVKSQPIGTLADFSWNLSPKEADSVIEITLTSINITDKDTLKVDNTSVKNKPFSFSGQAGEKVKVTLHSVNEAGFKAVVKAKTKAKPLPNKSKPGHRHIRLERGAKKQIKIDKNNLGADLLTITVDDDDYRVRLDIVALDLKDNDSFEVFDDDTENSNAEIDQDRITESFPIFSSGQSLTLKWSGNFSQIVVNVSTSQRGFTCAKIHDVVNFLGGQGHSSMVLETPNFGGMNTYLPYSECVWTISVPEGHQIRLDFESALDTVPDRDTVTISQSESGKILATYSGFISHPKSVKSGGNNMMIVFNVNSFFDLGTGFVARAQMIPID